MTRVFVSLVSYPHVDSQRHQDLQEAPGERDAEGRGQLQLVRLG